MQKDIHPQVYNDCIVTCACGSSFTTISTKKAISVEICSACHPFFTGQQRFVDTEGRIEKFAKKMKVSEAKKTETQAKKAEKAAKISKRINAEKPNLKELLKTSKSN